MTRALSLVASSGVVLVVGVIACSGGGVDSSCGNYVDALNSLAAKCGAQPFIDPSERSGFVDDCAALGKAPGANNLSSQIDACVNQVNASTCALNGLNCTIRGTLTDGSPCASSVQCAGGICNVTQPSQTSDISCGTCASYVALGGACGVAGTCDPSQGACVMQKCTAYVAQGGSCANGEPCVNGTTCDQTSKTCKTPPTKGEACPGVGSCIAPYKCISQVCADAVAQGGACPTGTECQSSLNCDTATKTCQPKTLAQVGQACGFVQNQYVQCATNLKCGPSSTCVALKASGDTCAAGQGECQPSLSCVNGTCAVPDYTICNK